MNGGRTEVVEHSTCLACGCLCDDIRVVVEGGQITEAVHACAIGRPWFLAPRPGEGCPPSNIDGEPAELSEAIAKAAEILASAKAPVVWGLSGSTVEAVASALRIADAIGAVVDPSGSDDREAKLRAFQRVGQVSSTLGEVKDRADLVVFWDVDPITTHPRHGERYSMEARGRFALEARTIVVVGHEPSATSARSDLCVHVPPDRRTEALVSLRAMIKGIPLDPDRVEQSTGCPFESLEDLARRLMKARYGAFFFGPSMGEGPGGDRAVEAALSMVADLNEGRRFVALTLGSPGNSGGAESVLAWQAGAPSAIDYGRGFPRYLPDEATLADRLDRGEVDAVLIVEGELPPALLEKMGNVPTIRIAPGATRPGVPSSVGFDVGRPGIESGGTVARVDGVMLPLRPSIAAGLPTARGILEAIGRQIEQAGGITSGPGRREA
ncbi:formylmethanofuran dehydrogenase subunit B [Tundrisphaera lichenicola]|uniref:formylmethanofuran dehydrogenase subunit B n=1 Tax=Tundrisphaera lichenicola TaxID=2029860 RepID=UPI003EB84C3F